MKLGDTKMAFVFPGQGAQYVGMGRDIYENFPSVRLLFEEADDLLKFNLTQVCFEGPAEKLKVTSVCQPAILAVSLATLQALEISCPDIKAGMTAGLSLGEYSALVAAGVLDFADAIRLVEKRGEFMDEASRLNPGQMISILGLHREALEQICKETGVEIANLNCPGQIVVSGGTDAVSQASRLAKEKGAKRVIPLEVSGPFHSSLMDPASKKLMFELNRVEIKTPKIPIVSNVTAYVENTPEEIRTNLVNQINHATRWQDSVRMIIDSGITAFLEIGPGKVLSGLIHRIDNSLDIYNIETAKDIDVFLEKIVVS
jgi:[acyl-carrier-protein] S-malonyltransferase